MPRDGSPWLLSEHQDQAWPEAACLRDPHAGDDAFLRPASYAEYLAYAPNAQASPEEFVALDLKFIEVYRGVLGGDMPWSEVAGVAEALGVWAPARHDRRPARIAPFVIPDEALADLAENWLPDIGLLAPGRILGPLADDLLPPRARMIAGAAMAFEEVSSTSVRAIERSWRVKPREPGPFRTGLKAIDRAPVCVWLVGPDGRLAPLLPLSAGFVPSGRLSGVEPSSCWVGRAVPGPDGPWLACALPLPSCPPADILVRRLRLELARLRRRAWRATWEDVLRDRSEVVYRTACEWCWHDSGGVWSWPSAWWPAEARGNSS